MQKGRMHEKALILQARALHILDDSEQGSQHIVHKQRQVLDHESATSLPLEQLLVALFTSTRLIPERKKNRTRAFLSDPLDLDSELVFLVSEVGRLNQSEVAQQEVNSQVDHVVVLAFVVLVSNELLKPRVVVLTQRLQEEQ